MTPSSRQSTTSMLTLSSPTYRFDPIMNPTRHLINVADVGPSDGRGRCANPRCMINGGIAPSTHKCPDCGMNIHGPCGKEMVNLAFVLCPLCERKRNNPQQVPTAAATTAVAVATASSAPASASTSTSTSTSASAWASASASASESAAKKRRLANIQQMETYFRQQYINPEKSIQVVPFGGQEVPCGGGKFSRLVSVCGKSVDKIEAHALHKFCAVANMQNWTRLTKKQLCDAIVKFKEDGPAVAAAVAGPRITANTAVIAGTSTKKLNGTIHLINCMFDPTILPLYANYGGSLGIAEMTAGKRKNQVMYENILHLYNSDDLADDHIAQIHHNFEGSDGLSALKKDCGTLESWRVVESVVKRIHRDFHTVKNQWKRSGENRDLPDILEGIATDLELEGNPWKIEKLEIHYFFLFLKDHPDILPSIHKALPSNVTRFMTPNNARTAAAKSSEKQKARDGQMAEFQATLQDFAKGRLDSKSDALRKLTYRLEQSITAQTIQMSTLEKSKARLRKEIKEMIKDSGATTKKKNPTKQGMSQSSDASLFSTVEDKKAQYGGLKQQMENLRSNIAADNKRLEDLRRQLVIEEQAESQENVVVVRKTGTNNNTRCRKQDKQSTTTSKAVAVKKTTQVCGDDSDDTGNSSDDERRWKKKKTSYGGTVDLVKEGNNSDDE